MTERALEGHKMGPQEKPMAEVDSDKCQETGLKLSTVPTSSQPC